MILFPGRHLIGVLECHHISYFEKLKLWAMFFSGFLRPSNYDRKKGTFIWPLVRMFGGSMSLDCFGGFLNQITTGKKGTVIWPSVAMFGGSVPWARIVLVGLLLCFLAGSLIKLQITTRKKRYSCLAIGWNVYYVLLTYYTLVDRPFTMTPWGIYPGRKILALKSGK